MTTTATAVETRRIGRVRLGDIDPDLVASGGPDGDGRAASVAVLEVAAGARVLGVESIATSARGGLVLRGLLLRDVQAGGGAISELIGPGDVIAAAADDADGFPMRVTWRALERTLIADLATVDPKDPSTQLTVAENIAGRLHDQARRASARCAITAVIRVDLRLLAYLWQTAVRFGTVTPAGVRLDLPLTHAVLAQLIGARRPTVTTAFRTLTNPLPSLLRQQTIRMEVPPSSFVMLIFRHWF